MSKTLLAGVVVAALATAGVMYANRPGDEPKPAQPPRPGMIAQPIVATAPVREGDGKDPGYTTNPRMRRAADLRIAMLSTVSWRPDGKALAVAGQVSVTSRNPQGPAKPRSAVLVVTEAADTGFDTVRVDTGNDRLIGYTPDGKQLVTELREHGLVSGFHRMKYWDDKLPVAPMRIPGEPGVPAFGPPPDSTREPIKTVELDTGLTTGCAFAADGKTLRTLRMEIGDDRQTYKRIEVLEVDAEKGSMKRSLLTVDEGFRAYDLGRNGHLLALLDDDDNVLLYDVDSGKKLWSMPAKLLNPEAGSQRDTLATVVISPDSRRVVATRGIGTPAVFEAANGRNLPALEGGNLLRALAGPGCFSSDGRLLALIGDRLVRRVEEGGPRGNPFGGRAPARPPQVSVHGIGGFLTVWDTETGKIVKSWNGSPIGIAFHPSKPILAILEKNGDDRTRLGLWDFSAEDEKRK